MFNSWYQPCDGAEDSGFTIRILPPSHQGVGTKVCLRIRNHRVGNQTFQCHKECVDGKWKGNCPICNQFEKFWLHNFSFQVLEMSQDQLPPFFKGSVDDFKHEVNSIKPIERYYFNIIVRGEEERGVLKWSCGRKIYSEIFEGIKGHPSNPNVVALGDITHVEKGHDLHIKKIAGRVSGNGIHLADFSAIQFLPFTPLGTSEQIKLWLSQLHNLNALRILAPENVMLDALEDVFGFLGPTRPKKKYRSLFDPFEPAW